MDQTSDWTGGVSDFALDPGSVSLITDSAPASTAPPDLWDAFLAMVGDMWGVPALPDVATATATGVGNTVTAIGNALPSVKEIGVWLVVVLIVVVIGIAALGKV